MTTQTVEDKNELRCDFGPNARVRYYHGMILTDNHFHAEQSYHRQRFERLNQYAHGSGILCGLTLSPWCCGVKISAGAALDCRGRLIEACESIDIDLSHICDEERKKCLPGQDLGKKSLCLAIRYNEQKAGLEAAYVPGADCDNKTCDYSRIQEGFCVVLLEEDDCQPVPCCECSTDACDQNPDHLRGALDNVKERLEQLCMPKECCDCPSEDKDLVVLGRIEVDCDACTVSVEGYEQYRTYVWTSERSRVLHDALCELRCIIEQMLGSQQSLISDLGERPTNDDVRAGFLPLDGLQNYLTKTEASQLAQTDEIVGILTAHLLERYEAIEKEYGQQANLAMVKRILVENNT